MPPIDERVVSAAFENAKFEAAVAVTMATLAKLDKSFQDIGKANSLADIEKAASKITLEGPMSALDKLKARLAGAGQGAAEGLGGIEQAGNKVTLEAPLTALDKVQAKVGQVGANAADGFNGIEQAGNKIELAGLTGALDSVTAKFSTLQAAAAVALGNIASQAAMRGAAFAKSFALGPIQAGLTEYTTNLNSIQTILANTQSSGGNLQTVNAALQELNTYSDKTIYNFGEMAKNIGTFTAAGVKLDTATQSIKGIANLAALSGSNSQQASTAMYQLSQAIAAGKVNLQDWNSVVNAGMGGEVFQKALFNTGKAMGTITNSPVGQTFEEWKKAGNSFRQSLSATQKAAQDGTSALAKAQKDGAQSVKDAQASAAEAVANAAKRVKDAQESAAESVANAAERVKSAQESQAESTKNAADRVTEAQKSAAESATAMAEKVKQAHKDVSDASKKTAADVREAQAAQRATFAQNAADVQTALEGVVEARKKLADALKPPSTDELQAAQDKLKGAQLDQADLATAITDAQTEQKRSAEDLAAAQKRLADVKNSGTPEEIQAATRAVQDAQKRQTDAADAVERAILRQNAATRDLHQAETDLQDTQKKGTETDQKVIDARDALTIATDKVTAAQKKAADDNIAAEKHIADVRLAGIAAQKAASKALADTEKQQTETLLKGRQAVADAEKAQTKTIIDSRAAVVKAEKDQAKTIIDSRESVAEAEKEQAKTTVDTRKAVVKAEQDAAEKIKAARASLNGGADSKPPSWLTSDVLTNTLKQFTGDMTAAQLKAQGFNDAQIKAIMATAKTAQDAATKVKTLGQVFDIARETIGSGWSRTFQLIFGDFGEARKTFTSLSNFINGFINANAKARNKVLEDWKALGGRAVLFGGLKQAFKDLMDVLNPIHDAFRDLFPAKTGKDLFDLTTKFSDLMKSLEPSKTTMENLQRTFRGVFAVLHIGVTIVKDVFGVFGDLFGLVTKGSGGGFLAFTGTIGDLLVALDKVLTQGGLLKKFFGAISTVLQQPLKLFTDLAGVIFGLFGGATDAKSSALSDSLDKVGKAAGPLTPILNGLKKAWDGLVHIFQQAKDLVSPWLDDIGEKISGFGTVIANAFNNMDFNALMSGLQTGFIGGIFLVLKKAIAGGATELTGALGGINKVFGALTGNLQAMQRDIQANTLLQIAAAIGLLAAGVFVLAKIDPKRLATALTAMAVGMAELMVAVKLMSSGLGFTSILTLPVLAAGLIGVAGAAVILAGAMKIFATMKWEDIAKGMAGIGGGLTAIGIGLKFIGPGAILQAPALIGIAIALNILAIAVKQFASMKWEDMARGIAGVLGALIAVAVPLAAIGPEILLVAPGLMAAAIAMNFLALAVKQFASMDPKRMFVGIAGMAAAMIIMAPAVTAMALALPGAVALAAAATGVTILAVALGLFGSLSLASIGKGLLAMGGSLAILAIGLTAMIAAAPGTVALLAASVALALLAPTLGFLGTLNWGTIVKGIAAMALVMGTMSVVGLVASEGLVALGLALLPLAGVLVVTAGAVFIFASALALLGDHGAKGIGVMIAAITAFVTLLPTLVINFVKGLVDILGALATVAPKVVAAFASILDTVIAFVIAQAPKLALAVGALVDAFLQVLIVNAPKLVAAGYKLLLDFLGGLDANIGEVATRAASIVVKFLSTLVEQAPALTASGANFLVQFLGGIAAQIPKLVGAAINVVLQFIAAVVGKLPDILLLGTKLMLSFVGAITAQIGKMITLGISIIANLLSGLAQAAPKLVDKAVEIAGKFVNAVADGLVRLTTAGANALINFINGLAGVIRTKGPELRAAGWNLADAIIDGMVAGFSDLGQKAIDAVKGVIGGLPGAAKKLLGINSPSKVFMEIGKFSAQGLVVGLQRSSGDVATAAGGMGDTAVSAIQNSMSKVGDKMSFGIDTNPTITPVLDLTNVKAGAKELNGLTSAAPIDTTFSTGLASAIVAETQGAGGSLAPRAAAAPVVHLEQTNNSPQALSEIEIYRQTNNLLSQVKGALEFATK